MYFSLSFNRDRYTRVLKGCFDENLDKVAISYLVLQNSLKLIKISKLGALSVKKRFNNKFYKDDWYYNAKADNI
jgi:hypothetical protein